MPVVAFAVGGIVDTVRPGFAGLLVPPQDANALRAAIRLLDDPERRGEMALLAPCRGGVHRPVGVDRRGLPVRPTATEAGHVSLAGRKPSRRDLGSIVRGLRRRQGMSVRKLAMTTDFSASFISQLERSKVSPSISSLERLAAGLGVTLGDFFKDVSATAVVHRVSRQSLTSGWSRARIEALDPAHRGQVMEAIMVTIAPGGTSGKRSYPDERERFIVIFEGALRLTLGESMHTLHRGDAVMVLPGVPCHWENRGKRNASLVIVSARR